MRPLEVLKETKALIIKRAMAGERVPALSEEYKIGQANIYAWVAKEKKEQGIPTITRSPSVKGTEALAQYSIDEKIDKLVEDFKKDMRALLIKQIMQKINGLE